MELGLAFKLFPFGIDEFKFHGEKVSYLIGKVNYFQSSKAQTNYQSCLRIENRINKIQEFEKIIEGR